MFRDEPADGGDEPVAPGLAGEEGPCRWLATGPRRRHKDNAPLVPTPFSAGTNTSAPRLLGA